MFLQKIQKTKQFVSPKSKKDVKGSGVSSILIILFPFTLSRGDQGKATLEVDTQISRIFNLPKST